MRIAIGIDIGGTNTKTVIATENGEVLLSHKIPTPSVQDKQAGKIETLLINNLKDLLDTDTARRAMSSASEVAGIGIDRHWHCRID